LDTQKTVDLLRRIRHDYGNNLQVILGYLDLGHPDLARQYVMDLVDDLAGERIIFESTDPETALYLYKQLLLSRDLGVILRYDEVKLNSPGILQQKREPLRSLQELLGRWNIDKSGKDLPVYLEICEKADGVDLLFSCESMETYSIVVEVRK
jgi:hypothetical protein